MNGRHCLMTLGLTWLLSGCSIGMYWIVDNQTSQPVEILIKPPYTWKIPAHTEEEYPYALGCVTMRIRNVDQQYLFKEAPFEYQKANVFSFSYFGRVDPDGALTLYSRKRPELPPIPVQKGCSEESTSPSTTSN